MPTDDRKPCSYMYAGCTWKTLDHDPTTRAKIEEYMRTHASKCPHNPTLRENRRRTRNREEAKERSLAEAELRRKNARQEGAANDELTRRNHQGQETSEKDLPEKCRQWRGVITKELPNGSCQGKGLAKEKPKTCQESKDYGRQLETADAGPPTHGTCICPQNDWCICGAGRTTEVTPNTH